MSAMLEVGRIEEQYNGNPEEISDNVMDMSDSVTGGNEADDIISDSENHDRPFPPSLLRRKTWPRLLLCISDIIYWEDGDAEEIGEGFYSKVYKFLHRPSGHTVVIKASKEDFETNDEDQAVMIKEIKLLKKLSHENIIKYLGLCARDGKFHPVLEYVNGQGLDRLLVDRTATITWPEKIGFCSDVAKGMKYLHSNHVFHRDLKSSNCLIRHGDAGTRTVVVADFGLAREVSGDTRTPRKMSMVGTAFWMAPELLNGKLYNSKVDVFSFGILACEILARVISDPDDLPRTPNFGLDLEKFEEMCPDCPDELLEMVKDCTEVNNIFLRPSFDKIVDQLEKIVMKDDDITEDYDVTVTSNFDASQEQNNNIIPPKCCTCFRNRNLSRLTEDLNENVMFQEKPTKDDIVPPSFVTDSLSTLQRRKGQSKDSGIADCDVINMTSSICPNCKKDRSFDYSKNPSNESSIESNSSNNIKNVRRTKKVSFNFISSLLKAKHRFRNNVIREHVVPSRGLSLRRSASLPDLKNHSENASNESVNDRKTRTKSCLYENVKFS